MIDKTDLPQGWAMATFESVTVPKVAQAPPGKEPVAYIDISSIDRNRKKIEDPKEVTSVTAPTRARQQVRHGDVLVSLTRPNLNAVALVQPSFTNAVASTGFDVLRPLGILSRFAFYRVQSREFVNDVCKKLQGVVYPAIRPTDVRLHNLPIPPRSEQARIVEALDSYLTRLDAAIEGLKRVEANLKRYRASVLKAAVEGRLVPTEAELARREGRDYELASVLLERILKERRRRWEEAELVKMTAKGKVPKDDKWKSKYKEPVAPDVEELPELPEGWCWATLEQVSVRLEGGNSATAANVASTRKVLRSSSVRQGAIDLNDFRYFKENTPQRPEPCISEGDLLITRLSGTLEYVGNCAVVPPLQGRCIEFPDRLFRASCPNSVNVQFLSFCFQVSSLRGPLEAKAKSTAGHQRISLSDLRSFCLPLPPFAEQKQLTMVLDEVLSTSEVIKNTAERSFARTQRLRQAILRWAFEGKLVDQDPNDEPAADLLERIRKERQATIPKKHPRRRKTSTNS